MYTLHRIHGTHARYRSALLVCFSLLLGGCGDGSDVGGPRITEFKYKDQFPADPYTAVFVFTFDAPSGISAGSASFYVGNNAEPQVKLKMADLLAASGLSRQATKGEVAAALRFQTMVSSETVDMFLQIDDDQERKSNKARVTLKFKYE